MSKIAPLFVISGEIEFLCHRQLSRMIQAAKKQNFQIQKVVAGDEEGLGDAIASSAMMKLFVVVESASQKKKTSKSTSPGWSDEALTLILDHMRNPDDNLVLVILHAGEASTSSLAGLVAPLLPKTQVYANVAPKPWEEKAAASKFLRSELKTRKKVMSEDLAQGVVARVGVDYGLLSYEALKISTYLDVDRRTEVTPADVAATIATFGYEDWEVLKDALASKNEKLVLKSLAEIRRGPGGDSIAKASAILLSTFVKWLHASALLESGLSTKDASERMGVNEYRFRMSYLKATQCWTLSNLKKFFRTLVEISVRNGHQNPWIALEVALVRGCISK